jgi:sugar phosphate isomerase/epimerase
VTSTADRAAPIPGRGISASTTMAWDWDLGRCIEAWVRVGLPAIGITRPQLEGYGRERGMQELRDSGLAIANYQGVDVFDLRDPARYAARQAKSLVYLDVAAELGADCVYVTTGPRGELPWSEAARHIVEQTTALLPELRARDLRLAIEPVHPLRQDLTFLNTATDTIDLLRAIDDPLVGYVFDTWHLWWERGIEDLARSSANQVFNVQVSDHKPKTLRTMDRAVPGAGIAPLGPLLHALAEGGYAGWWDLEVISDDNAAVGYEVALSTAVAALRDVWSAAGKA